MELSRDKIKEIINDDWLLMDDCEGNKNCDVAKDLARIALASLEADGAIANEGTITATQFKPVADLYGLTSPTDGETSFTFDAVEARDFIDGGWSCQEYVELGRFQEAVSGNSPVIQDGWVACSEQMPEVVLHMGQAMSVFEALKKEVISEHVRHAELGAMGAVNVQVWTSVFGGTLQYETSNGGCTLRVITAAPQQEVK